MNGRQPPPITLEQVIENLLLQLPPERKKYRLNETTGEIELWLMAKTMDKTALEAQKARLQQIVSVSDDQVREIMQSVSMIQQGYTFRNAVNRRIEKIDEELAEIDSATPE